MIASMPLCSSIASRLPNDFSISSSPATLRARSSTASATATNCAFGTRCRRFSAWRRPISPTPRTPTPSFFVIDGLCQFLASSSGIFKATDHAMKVGEAFGDADCRGNHVRVELHVLLDDGPAGIVVFLESAEKRGEVEVSLPDDGEDFVFDSFFKRPFISTGFDQDILVAVFDVDEAQLAFEFLRFFHGIGSGVIC